MDPVTHDEAVARFLALDQEYQRVLFCQWADRLVDGGWPDRNLSTLLYKTASPKLHPFDDFELVLRDLLLRLSKRASYRYIALGALPFTASIIVMLLLPSLAWCSLMLGLLAAYEARLASQVMRQAAPILIIDIELFEELNAPTPETPHVV